MPTQCRFNKNRIFDVRFLRTDDCFQLDTKQSYHILLIEKGLLSLEIDGESVSCPSPCLLVLKEDLELKFISAHMLSAEGIRFDVNFLNRNITFELINSGVYENHAEDWGFFPLEPFYAPEKSYQRLLPLALPEFVRIKELFGDFHHAIDKQIDTRWSCRARQHLQLILELVFQIYSDCANERLRIFDAKNKNVWISLILKEIHLGYSKPLKVSALAKRININRTTVEKAFRELVGPSINNYLVNYRLECAGKLLATTDLNVAEIGEQCGYKNSAFFNRQFKARMGFTPLEYRKRIVENRKAEFAEKNTEL